LGALYAECQKRVSLPLTLAFTYLNLQFMTTFSTRQFAGLNVSTLYRLG